MSWEIWNFRPRRLPLLTAEVAMDALEAMRKGQSVVSTSLDLWRSEVELPLTDEGLMIGSVEISKKELEELSDDTRTILSVTDEGLRPVEVRTERYYKLVNCGRGVAPTLEIDGIHMHRIKDVSPTEDALAKTKLLGRLKGKRVLDTCTGLGYTAIGALKREAEHIVTVELDGNVLAIAEVNPWSAELASESVNTIRGDVAEVVLEFLSGYFDAVVHDPPRFPFAGELYSLEFYRELARVLRKGGKLVHYVGHPGSLSGRRLYVGVMRRLREAGFSVKWVKGLGVAVGEKVS